MEEENESSAKVTIIQEMRKKAGRTGNWAAAPSSRRKKAELETERNYRSFGNEKQSTCLCPLISLYLV